MTDLGAIVEGALPRPSKKCSGCGSMCRAFAIPPVARGARTVEIAPCMNCDRITCPVCRTQVTNGKAKRCPKGHRL